MNTRQHAHHQHGAAADPREMTKDPICGLMANKAGAIHPSRMKPER